MAMTSTQWLVYGLLAVLLVVGALLWYKANTQSAAQFKDEARKWGMGLTIGSAGFLALAVAWEIFGQAKKGEAAAALLA